MKPLLSPADRADTEPDPIPLAEAYRACEAVVRSHDENFPVVSRLLTPARRHAVAAIYAFARRADDVADAMAPRRDRLEGLDRIEEALLAALDGSSRGPILTALADAVERHRLPVEPLLDLLAAFRRDARDETFATWDDLLSYCRGSANPIGRLVLALHEVDDPEVIAESDAVCTALQLTNFWQDLGRDLARGRLFIPVEDLRRAQLEPDQLRLPASREALTQVLAQECRATKNLFHRGAGIVRHVPAGLSLQLRATLAGGRAILREVERRGWEVLEHRPSLTRAARAGIVIRALLRMDG
jgi:squalene synthase HpnC